MLHSAMSGPLHQRSSDDERGDDDEEGDDELDDSDPEVCCTPSMCGPHMMLDSAGQALDLIPAMCESWILSDRAADSSRQSSDGLRASHKCHMLAS